MSISESESSSSPASSWSIGVALSVEPRWEPETGGRGALGSYTMPQSSRARDWLPSVRSLCFLVRWHMKPCRVTKSDLPQPWIGQVRYTRLASDGRFHRARPEGSWAAGLP